MRYEISDFIKRFDIGKISRRLNISEQQIESIIRRRTLQYVKGKNNLLRFDKTFSIIEGGTTILLEPFEVIRGFPKISRTLMLYPALIKHFSSCKKIAVEEKMNGYNVRVLMVGDELIALTRGGFICPYTTEKANYLIDRKFFYDHPDLVLCGEMVGPDSPYVPKTFYNIESLDFFAFDVRKKESGIPMPVMERRELMKRYGIKSVHLFGEFEIDDAHTAIIDIIKSFGDTLREGVVIKDPQMILPPIKYTSSLSNCADLKYAFEFYNDFGRDFFFGRVCREAFQSIEWKEDDPAVRKRCLELGESILMPMIYTIKNKKAGERIGENVQIRVKNLKTVLEFEDYLRLLGIDAIFMPPERIGDEYLVRIRKIHQSTNDKTETILDGHLWS